MESKKETSKNTSAENKNNKRQRRASEILESAKKEFLKNGYRGATIDMIAAEAGITKPTVYQYFSTKDEIILNLLEPLVRTIAEGLKDIHEKISEKKYSSGKNIIHDIFDVYYNTFENDPERFRLLTIFIHSGMISEMQPDSAGSIDRWGRMCFIEGQKICRMAIKQKLFRPVDVYQTTDYAWGTFWGIVQIVQNKRRQPGISRHLKPMMEFSKTLLIDSLVLK